MDYFNSEPVEMPDMNDSWAQVELWRWQYGELPQNGDKRELNISKGLHGMADAIEKGDQDNFPTPFNVISVLRYCAKIIESGECDE